MFNNRPFEDKQDRLKDLEYDLIQTEQEIEDEYEQECPDYSNINQLQHQLRRIQQDITELKMFWETAEWTYKTLSQSLTNKTQTLVGEHQDMKCVSVQKKWKPLVHMDMA